MSDWPEGFIWGTGASSTQAEGAAPRSDWYGWEQAGKVPPSGDGNGFATRHAEDFQLYAEHGLTHHRLSLEWARLEPEQGRHDPDEVTRYRLLLESARTAGVTIWACLHHFSLPGWFSDDLDGFRDDRQGRLLWSRHVDWVAETFGDLIGGWMPINEPTWYAMGSHRLGQLPPGRRNDQEGDDVLRTIHQAGADAARLLRTPATPVATIENLSPVFLIDDTEKARAASARLEERIWRSWASPEQLDRYDLVGFSYYSAIGVHGDGSLAQWPVDGRPGPMGYVPWAEGLAHTLHRLADEHHGRKLLVCEAGIGTDDEAERTAYTEDVLGVVADALRGGVDVAGLFWWTGVDNYEWHHGYDVRFGLFDRDRNPKPAATIANAAATQA
ncbi:MAG: family 1 glycosylhydrolase [Acidimicrobiales bacterium]